MQQRVLVADDHEVVRRGIIEIIEANPCFKVVGEAGNGRLAVREATRLKPDIMIMDLSMPELNGLEATRQVMASLPETQVLILSMQFSEMTATAALSAGARGYILKSDAGQDLLAGMTALSQRRPFFTAQVADMVMGGYLCTRGTVPPKVHSHELSPREKEIVQLLAEGNANKEVAHKLSISVKTVETHRAHVMTKLNLHSIADLVRFAIRNGIVPA
jgi:DNA-binding NarL/FixJ family response regulator